MESNIYTIIFLIVELIVALLCLFYIISITWSLWKGAPFVPSRGKDVTEILTSISLKKGDKFLELGCGDGRVVCEAFKKYGVQGRGVDVSILWLIFARFRARLLGIGDSVDFRCEDIRQTDIAWADVIYLYMMPTFLEKYSAEIFSKCRPGTRIVSYVFDIPYLKEKSQSSKQEGKYYIYQV